MINLKKKIVAVVTTVTVAAWMIPGSAFAITADELQVQINALLAQLSALQSQLATLEGGTTGGAITGVPAGFTFDTNLKQGDSSDAVKYLQIVLNSDSATQVAASGVGSAGNETMYFGPLTKAAVVKFQEKYASEVLATYGLTVGTGFVGTTTRAKLNSLLTAGVVEEVPTEEVPAEEEPVSTTATVSLAADTPAAAQIALGASNALATKIKFTGGTEDYTVSKVVIKRGGVAADADVSAIKLYDGIKQLGSSQALNTNTHKAAFSSLNWVIPAGTTKYLTVKVSIAAKGTATVGDSIKLGIESASDIVSTATLTGTFPMEGNALTLAGISVGELFVAAQTTPADATVLSGATEQEIANFRFTASSSEAVYIHSITITHVGTAAAEDISNIKLKYAGAQIGSTVDGLDSSNQATFDLSSSPFQILQSQSKDIYAYTDIAPGIWTSRTIIFEITQYTDVTVYGANSGGAIEAAASDTAAFSKQTSQTMTIGQGSLTVNIDGAYNPASQNYVKGTLNRLMSAFKFTAGAREGVRVVKLKLKLNNGSGSATDVSNITLWDGSTQIAGPVSLVGSYATFGSNTIGWDETGLFDVSKSGNKTIQVKADIPSGATTDHTVDLDIAALTDVWIDGLDSKYDITQDSTNIVLTSGNANLHTVTANGALTASLSANTPPAQTYIKGATGVEMLRINLAADSGEDMTVSSLTVDLKKDSAANAVSGDYTNVKLLKSDGTQLGSVVTAPTNEAAFSFNLTVPASETITLKAITDIPSGTSAATGNFQVTNNGDITTQGVASSATIDETVSSVTGKTMTFGQGSLAVSGAALPGDQNVIIGSTKVSVVGLVFTSGSAEDVRITRIKLSASGATGTDACLATCYADQENLFKIALYDGDTRLTTEKGWDSTTATTVTFSASDFLNSSGIDVTKGGQKTITVKADIPSTATAGHSIALGIASSSDLADGMSGGDIGTRDVVFTGLDSNTTPTTTLNYANTTGGVNFTTSSHPGAVHYLTLQSSGTLTLTSSPDTPVSNIVTVGPTGGVKQDAVFLKVDFAAAREDIDVKALTINRANTNKNQDNNFASISLWDGTTQLGVDQVLVNAGLDNSSTTFTLPAGSYWRIPKDTTKVLTVKADIYGVKSTEQSGTETGTAPTICLASSTNAIGASSGQTVSADTAAICGNYQVLHKSKPTVAAASLPSTTFSAGEKTLYRWTVTAGSDGAIGWGKVIFDVSGSVQVGSDTYTIGAGGGATPTSQNTSTDGIYMGTTTTPVSGDLATQNAKLLIATGTLKVYNVATGDEILATTSVNTFGRGVYVWNYAAGGARVGFIPSAEQVIAAGETKTYELRGDILYGGKAGDSISTKIAKRATATSTGTFTNIVTTSGDIDATMYVTSTAPTFVWTDRSGAGATAATHTWMTSNDWSQEYKVPTFPTATLSLSK